MGDELTLLLEVFHKIEKAGGQASLSVATVGGKTKMKLEIATTPVPPTESSSTSSRARQLGVAIVAAVREQGLAATSVQLLTRLPWQRQQPVLHWKTLHLVHLSNYFPRRLLILGGAR